MLKRSTGSSSRGLSAPPLPVAVVAVFGRTFPAGVEGATAWRDDCCCRCCCGLEVPEPISNNKTNATADGGGLVRHTQPAGSKRGGEPRCNAQQTAKAPAHQNPGTSATRNELERRHPSPRAGGSGGRGCRKPRARGFLTYERVACCVWPCSPCLCDRDVNHFRLSARVRRCARRRPPAQRAALDMIVFGHESPIRMPRQGEGAHPLT